MQDLRELATSDGRLQVDAEGLVSEQYSFHNIVHPSPQSTGLLLQADVRPESDGLHDMCLRFLEDVDNAQAGDQREVRDATVAPPFVRQHHAWQAIVVQYLAGQAKLEVAARIPSTELEGTCCSRQQRLARI